MQKVPCATAPLDLALVRSNEKPTTLDYSPSSGLNFESRHFVLLPSSNAQRYVGISAHETKNIYLIRIYA